MSENDKKSIISQEQFNEQLNKAYNKGVIDTINIVSQSITSAISNLNKQLEEIKNALQNKNSK